MSRPSIQGLITKIDAGNHNKLTAEEIAFAKGLSARFLRCGYDALVDDEKKLIDAATGKRFHFTEQWPPTRTPISNLLQKINAGADLEAADDQESKKNILLAMAKKIHDSGFQSLTTAEFHFFSIALDVDLTPAFNAIARESTSQRNISTDWQKIMENNQIHIDICHKIFMEAALKRWALDDVIRSENENHSLIKPQEFIDRLFHTDLKENGGPHDNTRLIFFRALVKAAQMPLMNNLYKEQLNLYKLIIKNHLNINEGKLSKDERERLSHYEKIFDAIFRPILCSGSGEQQYKPYQLAIINQLKSFDPENFEAARKKYLEIQYIESYEKLRETIVIANKNKLDTDDPNEIITLCDQATIIINDHFPLNEIPKSDKDYFKNKMTELSNEELKTLIRIPITDLTDDVVLWDKRKETRNEYHNKALSFTNAFVRECRNRYITTPSQSLRKTVTAVTTSAPADAREITKKMIFETLWGDINKDIPTADSVCGTMLTKWNGKQTSPALIPPPEFVFVKPTLKDIAVENNGKNIHINLTAKHQAKTDVKLTLSRDIDDKQNLETWTCQSTDNVMSEKMRFEFIAAESFALRKAQKIENAEIIGIMPLEEEDETKKESTQFYQGNNKPMMLSAREEALIGAHIKAGFTVTYGNYEIKENKNDSAEKHLDDNRPVK